MGRTIRLSETVDYIIEGQANEYNNIASRIRHECDEYRELIHHCAEQLYQISSCGYPSIEIDAKGVKGEVVEILETGRRKHEEP